MILSMRLEGALHRLSVELRHVEYGSVHTIFGSAAMAIRGILPRDPGDIDIMLPRVTWAGLMARGWRVETPAAGDPPLLTLDAPIPVHAFYDWNDEHVHMNVEQVLAEGEKRVVSIHGRPIAWRLAPLETLLHHKQEAMAWEGSDKALEPGKFDRHRVDIEILRSEIARRGVTSMISRSNLP